MRLVVRTPTSVRLRCVSNVNRIIILKEAVYGKQVFDVSLNDTTATIIVADTISSYSRHIQVACVRSCIHNRQGTIS